MIVGAVIIISIFKAEETGSTHIVTVSDEGSIAWYTTLCVIWGIIGAVFYSLEIMCNKWLSSKR